MNCLYCGRPCGTHAPDPVCWHCKNALADEIMPEEEFEVLSGEWVERQINKLNKSYLSVLNIQGG